MILYLLDLMITAAVTFIFELCSCATITLGGNVSSLYFASDLYFSHENPSN